MLVLWQRIAQSSRQTQCSFTNRELCLKAVNAVIAVNAVPEDVRRTHNRLECDLCAKVSQQLSLNCIIA